MFHNYLGYEPIHSFSQHVLPSTIAQLERFGCTMNQFLNFHPLSRYVNVPALFGQPNIANIFAWHYLWDENSLPFPSKIVPEGQISSVGQ